MTVVHNHPSGSPSPSRADRKLTSELVAGTRMMSIDFLDHVIVARSQFASMAELGLMDARFHEEAGEEQGSA